MQLRSAHCSQTVVRNRIRARSCHVSALRADPLLAAVLAAACSTAPQPPVETPEEQGSARPVLPAAPPRCEVKLDEQALAGSYPLAIAVPSRDELATRRRQLAATRAFSERDVRLSMFGLIEGISVTGPSDHPGLAQGGRTDDELHRYWRDFVSENIALLMGAETTVDTSHCPPGSTLHGPEGRFAITWRRSTHQNAFTAISGVGKPWLRPNRDFLPVDRVIALAPTVRAQLIQARRRVVRSVGESKPHYETVPVPTPADLAHRLGEVHTVQVQYLRHEPVLAITASGFTARFVLMATYPRSPTDEALEPYFDYDFDAEQLEAASAMGVDVVNGERLRVASCQRNRVPPWTVCELEVVK